ncbi:MAG: hypothetical protein MUE62_06340 [Burkholderiaceae bacterium]|nr:hypothetical protein [Burkholderiaceae bacterium]
MKTRTTQPKTAAQFLAAIQSRIGDWRISTEAAEANDPEAGVRIVFSLADDVGIEAAVHFEYGRLIVSMRNAYAPGDDYWFAFERLREHDAQGWSWQQQIGRKVWARPEHVRLLDALDELWPPARDGSRVPATATTNDHRSQHA